MEHLKMTTPDGAEMNLDALYKICPSCFTEAKTDDGGMKRVVDWNKLRALLGDNAVEDAPEAYDFTWVGKRAAQREAAAPINKTLRPYPKESVDWDNTQNLYIEGDNLEVLKLLQNSYMGKVKMIYIDPPYNTGNDFVYHDDFSQSAEEYDENNINENGERFRKNKNSNGRFHSDWCSMMFSRLMVARTLLKDDGVIFISIDDHEYDNLKKICDEVFGDVNFINAISVNMNSLSGVKMTHAIKGKRFPAQKEMILLYKKGIVNPVFHIEKLHKDEWDKEYNLIIPNLNEDDFIGFQDKTEDEVNEYLHDKEILSLSDYSKQENIEITDEWKWENAYRIFGSKSNRLLANKYRDYKFDQDVIAYRNEEGNMRFFLGQYNREARDPRVELVNAEANSSVFLSDSWADISNDGGVAQEGGVPYPNGKKPLQLINRMVKAANLNDGDLVLDFFSGSASTAHSVMKESAKRSINLKFIMIQFPEDLDITLANSDGETMKQVKLIIKFLDRIERPHILTEVGKERIRNVKEEIKRENPSVDTGFRVFKCDSSNMKDVYFAPKDYSQDMLVGLEDNIKEDRTDLDLLFDCMLRWGVELSLPVSSKKVGDCTIHNVNEGDLVACFSGVITEDIIDAIAEMNPLRVVFRDSSFEEASEKMNLFELFKQKCQWSDAEVKNNVKVI